MRREPLWESAIMNYVRAALEIAVWDFALGVVLLPEIEQGNRPCHQCATLQELRAYLLGVARLGWDSCLPRDGEQPKLAFEDLDVRSAIDLELMVHSRTLELMRWMPKESTPQESTPQESRPQTMV